jgi:hypothetical protein
MTRERLLEAINRNDPDGKGVERVIQAAREGALNKCNCRTCLLAVAWDIAKTGGSVGLDRFNREENGGDTSHPDYEVVSWFDDKTTSNEWLLILLENA